MTDASKKLRETKPIITDINSVGRPDPRFKPRTVEIPAKLVQNTKSSMDLLDLYTKGALRDENFGRVCGTCVYYYPDPNLGSHKGRCKFYGFKQVHESLAADVKQNYTEPEGRFTFGMWPGCPTYTPRSRMSRH